MDFLPTAERVAATLRHRILAGELTPGSALREEALANEIGVSRNTLREGLLRLQIEGLAEQKLYSGTTVAQIRWDAIKDIFIVRRTLELQAITFSAQLDDSRFAPMIGFVAEIEQAASDEAWAHVGTASLQFHQSIVAFLGSNRLNAFFEIVAAQLRLAFSQFRNEASFQAPWIARDRKISHLICSREPARAAAEMSAYLDDSERTLIEVLRATDNAKRGERQRLQREAT